MNSRPVVIAIVLTLISSIPLYLLSSSGLELSPGNFPLFALSLFVLLLIAAFWAATAKHKDIVEGELPLNQDQRETGNVKWFNANKGFGFITRDSGDDIFVHFRSIRGEGRRVLRDGQRVEFAVVESDKGLQAEDVAVAR
jgi:CspA family cold shock protein